jgi:predicted transcriptional regulator
MPIQKEEIDLLLRKPDELDPQEVLYADYVKRKIEEGIKAADEGRILSHDELKRFFAR